jgi:hypothetical protein
MDAPERPDDDASAAEIAEWMEEDFGRAVAEGMANAGDEDEQEVVEVEILNHERGEAVAPQRSPATASRNGLSRRKVYNRSG